MERNEVQGIRVGDTFAFFGHGLQVKRIKEGAISDVQIVKLSCEGHCCTQHKGIEMTLPIESLLKIMGLDDR